MIISTLVARLEKTLVLLLLAAFALPLTLGYVLLLPRTKTIATTWLRNRTLGGVQVPREQVALQWASLLSAGYQTSRAKDYDLHFAGRELMIRLIDELYLHAFRTSPAGVVVGPRFSLVESSYPREYCLARGPADPLRPLVENLRRMQDFCDARGMAFALVITPSKAAIYPGELPSAWMSRYKHEPRYYDLLLPLLQEKGIRFVDGHRLTADMKPAAVPLFPLGGVHWGDPAAFAATDALLELLARSGLGVRPIQSFKTTVSNDPHGQDRDLVNLLNTVFDWHYPVASVSVQPVTPPPAYRPNLVVVGGSFTWKMLAMLDASRQFSETEFYFYYRQTQFCVVDGETHEVAQPAPPLNFDTDVFAADALVLELNEETLTEPARHLTAFLQDALAVLPDPHAAKAPFHYETRLHYRWGDTLSFVAGQNVTNVAATRGFETPQAEGAYTVGSVAAIHFQAEPPPDDMVLEVDATPFVVDSRLTGQRVSVYANDHPVGEWQWHDRQLSRRELVIPKEVLAGGEVEIKFLMADPRAPVEFGRNGDTRKLGLRVSRIRLRAVHGAEDSTAP